MYWMLFDQFMKPVTTIQKSGGVNVNVAPLTVEEFKLLLNEKIGTYQIFQETYHHETYKKVHLGGKKMDYNWPGHFPAPGNGSRIGDVGIGVLFGLADYRFELLAMMQHINELERVFGIGPPHHQCSKNGTGNRIRCSFQPTLPGFRP